MTSWRGDVDVLDTVGRRAGRVRAFLFANDGPLRAGRPPWGGILHAATDELRLWPRKGTVRLPDGTRASFTLASGDVGPAGARATITGHGRTPFDAALHEARAAGG